MASSSHSNSDLYKCPDNIICREEFNDLNDFFSKQHWEKHKNKCPMPDCTSTSSKPSNFKSHWKKFPTHREYLGLPEEREDCISCGQSYIKQYKGNHKRDCGKPKNKVRKWDEMKNELATSEFMHEPLRVNNESYGDRQSITRPDGDGILQDLPTWNDISGLGLAGHGSGIEADFGEIAEWLADFSNSEDPLPLSMDFGSEPENFDYELEDLMKTISPSSQQRQSSARLADGVASRVPQLGMELPIPTVAANDTTTLVPLSSTTGLSTSDVIVIPPTTEFADANDVTFQRIPRDFDRPDDGHFPGIYTTYDFEQPGFMLTVLENTGCQSPATDRYRLGQRRYEPAPAGSRTMFTYSQEVAVKRFAPGLTPQSITVLRQWLQKVDLHCDIYQKLSVKGADVTARDFSIFHQTASGLVCRQTPETRHIKGRACQIPETLRILLNCGHDIVISHEIDKDLYSLYDAVCYHNTDKVRQALSRTAVAVLNNYFSMITCDGMYPNVDVHQHTEVCLTFYASECADLVDTEDATLNAIARLTPQTSQSVFLQYIYDQRGGLFNGSYHLTTELVNSIGDLHYRASFWSKDNLGRWESIKISPLKLASQNIYTWDIFQETLDHANISWPLFIEDELTTPDRNPSDYKWCPNMLRALSEIRYMDYVEAMSIKWLKFFKWLQAEVLVSRRTTLSQSFQWDEVLADLNQNESLKSVELRILQRLDQFASRMAHHEGSRILAKDGHSKSSDEDSECLYENELSESSDEDEEVDLYQRLQEVKGRG
jgi:hypothetical protein